MKQLIKLKNISKIYKMSDIQVKALDDVDLVINEGEFIALVGPSGSGKSTLMNILGCLDVPSSGSYILNNENIETATEGKLAKIRNENIGFVFQSFNLLNNMSAVDNVSLPCKYAKMRTKESRRLANEALKLVGLENRRNHKPYELSGGEQQRVAFARALLNKPSILLADEPTGNLDSNTSKEILDLMCDLNEQGTTIILVTHDRDIASIAKRKIKLFDGKIVDDLQKDVI
ncbi:MAG: ABC transporter ATP-binding protein [Clostridiales bacterium]|nr:ABC transporter ATP-binding protein [Clostridiales bacterium]